MNILIKANSLKRLNLISNIRRTSKYSFVRLYTQANASRRRHRFLPKFLLKEHIVAPKSFNRWRIPLSSVSVHLCIGSVYSWSIFNAPLTKTLGVVAPSAIDWSLSTVFTGGRAKVPIFSTAIVCLGLSAAFAGKWLEEVGPRCVGVLSAVCWSGGFFVGAYGIHTHQIALLYVGYGVLGGCGLGLGYVSPVSTLIKWFPDRRGMATGMAIMGFGGGAMIGTPLKVALLRYFFVAPQYVGDIHTTHVVAAEHGKLFTKVGDSLREVVVATHADLASVPGAEALREGVYLVGSGGSTGVAQTFLTLGCIYLTVMLFGSFTYRVPRDDFRPSGSAVVSASPRYVHIDDAWRTPQFWSLWTLLCLNVTAGIGVIGVAKTMMDDIFGAAYPHIVTSAFSANYVLMISVFNMIGRFFWASASDKLSRKLTYTIFFGLGVPLYCSLPYAAALAGVGTDSVVPLVYFYACSMLLFSFYGGGFATIPAYIADLFGTQFTGGIHGRLLTAWSVAGAVGPLCITYLRESAAQRAIVELAAKADPKRFEEAFGAGVDQLAELSAAQTVTIARLMDLMPESVRDPTPFLYSTTMYSMAGLLSVAFIVNARIRPVSERFLRERERHAEKNDAEDEENEKR